MYGLNNKEEIYDESSKMIPNSPYAEGKYLNHLKVKNLERALIGIFTLE